MKKQLSDEAEEAIERDLNAQIREEYPEGDDFPDLEEEP